MLVACAPPDPPVGGGALGVEILHPPADVGSVALDDDGVLRILIVVDVNGIEFVEPGTVDEDVEGQGHWHLHVNGGYEGPPPARFILWEDEAAEEGQNYAIRASMATNDHNDVIVDGIPVDDTIEFTIAAAGGS